MNVLLIGSGGREHALAWKLAQSPLLEKLCIAPGNPGTASIGENIPVDATNIELILDIARRKQIGLVVVGPEAPLAAGLADACHAAGIAVFGPTRAAAQLESSKAFAKQIMRGANVPTAETHIFTDTQDAATFARQSRRPWVVKADGLASGKGVVVADTVEATLDAIAQLGRTHAGHTLLLEEHLHGREVSVLALCDGERLLALPPAQDHKRLCDGDHGPNTGGMGAFAPSPLVDDALLGEIVELMLLPVVRELAVQGTPFRGVLYAGIMLTAAGPYVLEFNARFGDPETQVLMPLIDGDLLVALVACAENRLDPAMLTWKNAAAACVVLAAAGYPDAPRTGDPIIGLESIDDPNTLVFHAGTEWQAGQICTSGGRVLSVTSVGERLDVAVEQAYASIEYLAFDGMQYRRDIGRTSVAG